MGVNKFKDVKMRILYREKNQEVSITLPASMTADKIVELEKQPDTELILITEVHKDDVK